MKHLGGNGCEFRTGTNSVFRLMALPGMVALYGEGHFQFFSNPHEKPVEKLLSDEAAIVAAAQLHKEGVTNKDRFLESVARLFRDRALTEYGAKQLRVFIHSCDCGPAVVRAKLRNMGYAGLIERIEFEDRHPQLEISVFAIQEFLKQSVGDSAHAQVVPSPSTPA